MKTLSKTIFLLSTFAIIMCTSHFLFADLNYIFGGRMYISGDPNLTYNICYWSSQSKKMELSPVQLQTNIPIDLAALAGFNYCLNNNLSDTNNGCVKIVSGSSFILVPNLPFTDFEHPENEQTFQNDLKAGKLAPYICVGQTAGILTIYIVGPTNISKFAAQKLLFNVRDFETTWVYPGWWWHGGHHGNNLFFAFSFDATTGTFRHAHGNTLSSDSFFIADPGAQNWLLQENRIKPNALFSIANLQQTQIIQTQGPFINIDELQSCITYINWSGFGNFENVK
jgi:hypothetical protein